MISDNYFQIYKFENNEQIFLKEGGIAWECWFTRFTCYTSWYLSKKEFH